MGTIISSIKDCFNNMFSKSQKNIPKEEFNITSTAEENTNNKTNDKNTQKLIPLLDLSDSPEKNDLLSPKN